MHQVVDRDTMERMGPQQQGSRFPFTHPDQLADHVFLFVHDMDGTAVHSYDSMLIPHYVANDLPKLFSETVARQYSGTKSSEQAQMLVSEFFNQLFEGKRAGTPISRTEYYYQQVAGHGVTLHEPEKALDIVLERTIADFKKFAKDKGVSFPATAETEVREGFAALARDKYAHNISIAHTFYEGFTDWLGYCREERAENALHTNTKLVFTLNKLRRTSDAHTAERLNTDSARLIFAQEDDSVKQGGVKWDGSAEDGQRLMAWLKKNDYVPADPEQAQLYALDVLSLHKHMRAYSGNKPNGVPIKRIIAELGPDIERRINDGLASNGYEGEPFKLTPKNVMMIGESASDFGCIADMRHDEAEVKTPGYYARLKIKLDSGEIPRLARFAWQAAGTLQHTLAVETDHRVRGSERSHLGRMHACQREHDMAGVADVVLPRGYISLMGMAERCCVKVGLSCAPALLTNDLTLLKHADPDAWRTETQRRWHANGSGGVRTRLAPQAECLACG